jgi:hypothetical protein
LRDEVGLRQRQLVVGGLQPVVVEQRDLDGGLRAERAAEQTPDGALRPLGIISGTYKGDLLADGLAGDIGQPCRCPARTMRMPTDRTRRSMPGRSSARVL